MPIPTEPIGSIPRPLPLVEALASHDGDDPLLEPLYLEAVRDTIARFEATGSPVVTDGEQRKYHNFWTYCVHGLPNAGADGFRIPFSAGHTRRMPRLTSAPFRYRRSAELLPSLFQLEAGSFYVALASERKPERVLAIIREHVRPGQRVFVGVVDPIDPRIETPEQVCERVRLAARYLSPDQLGTTDDCGFAPFCDDISTTRDSAFAKMRARVAGTALAARALGLD